MPTGIAMVTLLLCSLSIAGCHSPASKGSPESVRDPLGIDRAVMEYYDREGAPEPESYDELANPYAESD